VTRLQRTSNAPYVTDFSDLENHLLVNKMIVNLSRNNNDDDDDDDEDDGDCWAYYRVCNQLISQQNTVLQVQPTCCAK